MAKAKKKSKPTKRPHKAPDKRTKKKSQIPHRLDPASLKISPPILEAPPLGVVRQLRATSLMTAPPILDGPADPKTVTTHHLSASRPPKAKAKNNRGKKGRKKRLAREILAEKFPDGRPDLKPKDLVEAVEDECVARNIRSTDRPGETTIGEAAAELWPRD